MKDYHYIRFTLLDETEVVIRLKEAHIKTFLMSDKTPIDYRDYKTKTRITKENEVASFMHWGYCVNWQEKTITFSEDQPSFFHLFKITHIEYLGTDKELEKLVHTVYSYWNREAKQVMQVY